MDVAKKWEAIFRGLGITIRREERRRK